MSQGVSDGVRKLKLKDIAPNCEITINEQIFTLEELGRNKVFADIGCGFGATRKPVESVGGKWIGVEPFEGGAHTIVGDAMAMPFVDESIDVVYMNAVLEHVPDPSLAFKEASRVLKKGGVFAGYVAFMECFHEISYCHLSFKSLEYFSEVNGMQLVKISGGHRFGLDYHSRILFYPLNVPFIRVIKASIIRGVFYVKSRFTLLGIMLLRKKSFKEAKALASLYYKVECLRQSVGFYFYIVKN